MALKNDWKLNDTVMPEHMNDIADEVNKKVDTTGATMTGDLVMSGSSEVNGNAATASKLKNPRKINNVDFDGTKDITIGDDSKLPLTGGELTGNLTVPIVNGDLNGNASTATKLHTARTINGTIFDGTKDITTETWGLPRGITIGATTRSVDGSIDLAWSLIEIGAAALNHVHDYLPLSGGTMTGQLVMNGNAIRLGALSEYPRIGYDSNTQDVYISNANNNWFRIKADKTMTIGGSKVYTAIEPPTAQEVGALPLTGGTLTGNLTVPTVNGALNGNASSATKLQTARTINGTSFDGTANITTAQWGTARNLQVGNTSKSVNGSTNVSWSLSEIGALPLTGGILTGTLTMGANINPNSNNTRSLGNSTNRFANGYINELHSVGLTCDTGDLWLTSQTGANNHYIRIQGSLIPHITSSMYLGTSANRWNAVYASNGTIQTSDERYKADIQDIDDEQFFDMVKGVSVNTYVMLDKRKDMMTLELLEDEEHKQKNAKSERVQVGIIAQDMARFDCGKYILVHDEETDVYSVNNYNFTSAVMAALKVEIKKREELESKCIQLEERLSALEELVLNKVA